MYSHCKLLCQNIAPLFQSVWLFPNAEEEWIFFCLHFPALLEFSHISYKQAGKLVWDHFCKCRFFRCRLIVQYTFFYERSNKLFYICEQIDTNILPAMHWERLIYAAMSWKLVNFCKFHFYIFVQCIFFYLTFVNKYTQTSCHALREPHICSNNGWKLAQVSTSSQVLQQIHTNSLSVPALHREKLIYAATMGWKLVKLVATHSLAVPTEEAAG